MKDNLEITAISQRKQDALRQSKALSALSSEKRNAKINPKVRAIVRNELLTHLPELTLIEALVSKKCKSMIALIFPGSATLGIKTMNDSLIGYSLNNSYLIPKQIKIVEAAFFQAFADVVGDKEDCVIIFNNFKGVILGTSIVHKAQLTKIIKKALNVIDSKMKAVFQHALEIGLQFWKTTRIDNAHQRIINIQSALAHLAQPNWMLEAFVGIARIKKLRPNSHFEEIACAAIEARIKVLQGRAVARSEFNENVLLGKNHKDNRVCYFDNNMLLKVTQESKKLRLHFFKNKKSRAITFDRIILPIMEKNKNKWTINPDIIRLHRKGQLPLLGLNHAENKLLRTLQKYLDNSRIFAAMLNFTYDELPQLYRHLKQVFQLLEKLTYSKPLSRQDHDFIKRVLDENITGHTISGDNCTSFLRFFNFQQAKKHRIYLNADVINLGVVGRVLAVEQLDQMGNRSQLNDKSLLKAVLCTGDPAIKRRRLLCQQVSDTYVRFLKKLSQDKMKDEVMREIEAASQDTLVLIAGDEITLSMHPMIKPFLSKIVKSIAQKTSSRVAISEAFPTKIDYHEIAVRQADAGFEVLKKYESETTNLLMRVKTLNDKPVLIKLEEKIVKSLCATLFVYVTPEYKLKLYNKKSGKAVTPKTLDDELDQLNAMIEACH